MNTIKNLLTKSSKIQKTQKQETSSFGSFRNGALGRFNSPSIVDILVRNKNETEVTFKDTVKTAGILADELVSLTLRIAEPKNEDIDFVEEFIGKELEDFYEECASLQEVIRKEKIQKAITSFLFKTWKENAEDADAEDESDGD